MPGAGGGGALANGTPAGSAAGDGTASEAGSAPAADGAMTGGRVNGMAAWSGLDSQLEMQLRNQITAAQQAMHDGALMHCPQPGGVTLFNSVALNHSVRDAAHKRLALKHVKNEALIGQLKNAEKKVESLEEELKASKRSLDQAERRFAKRIDTKSKLVEELKEELTEKDRRCVNALSSTGWSNHFQ